MFKKLDILIIRSYIGPFIVTFFITLFVLVMQFFWLYMDELIGKGLSVWMILQLLALMSTTMVPLALPLAVLLASIMTFGNMGENFELVAIKSSGISLNRFMRPLLVLIIFISGFAFIFNNNVIPVANLKALSLLYDLRNAKPALNIRAGLFNKDIAGFSIRVGEKDKDGTTIRDIIIYDQTEGYGNSKIILAKEGMMIPSPDKQYMIFRLKDGWRYEEKNSNGNIRTQTRTHFGEWNQVFDLSSFKVMRTNEDLFRNAYQMMDVQQLETVIDSVRSKVMPRLSENVNNYIRNFVSAVSKDGKDTLLKSRMKQVTAVSGYEHTFLDKVQDSLRTRVLQLVISNNRNIRDLITMSAHDRRNQVDNLHRVEIEFHKKFSLSFACILLFLIGAPLGAIIRKGGLGMPLIIAIGFFLVWYIISITGEKLSKSGAAPAWVGMWISTVMLLPIALVMIRQARNDSQIFSREWYARSWNKIVNFVYRKKTR